MWLEILIWFHIITINLYECQLLRPVVFMPLALMDIAAGVFPVLSTRRSFRTWQWMIFCNSLAIKCFLICRVTADRNYVYVFAHPSCIHLAFASAIPIYCIFCFESYNITEDSLAKLGHSLIVDIVISFAVDYLDILAVMVMIARDRLYQDTASSGEEYIVLLSLILYSLCIPLYNESNRSSKLRDKDVFITRKFVCLNSLLVVDLPLLAIRCRRSDFGFFCWKNGIFIVLNLIKLNYCRLAERGGSVDALPFNVCESNMPAYPAQLPTYCETCYSIVDQGQEPVLWESLSERSLSSPNLNLVRRESSMAFGVSKNSFCTKPSLGLRRRFTQMHPSPMDEGAFLGGCRYCDKLAHQSLPPPENSMAKRGITAMMIAQNSIASSPDNIMRCISRKLIFQKVIHCLLCASNANTMVFNLNDPTPKMSFVNIVRIVLMLLVAISCELCLVLLFTGHGNLRIFAVVFAVNALCTLLLGIGLVHPLELIPHAFRVATGSASYIYTLIFARDLGFFNVPFFYGTEQALSTKVNDVGSLLRRIPLPDGIRGAPLAISDYLSNDDLIYYLVAIGISAYYLIVSLYYIQSAFLQRNKIRFTFKSHGPSGSHIMNQEDVEPDSMKRFDDEFMLISTSNIICSLAATRFLLPSSCHRYLMNQESLTKTVRYHDRLQTHYTCMLIFRLLITGFLLSRLNWKDYDDQLPLLLPISLICDFIYVQTSKVNRVIAMHDTHGVDINNMSLF